MKKKTSTYIVALILIAIGIPFLASIVFSKSYWGYYFTPPLINLPLHEIKEIESITWLINQNDKNDIEIKAVSLERVKECTDDYHKESEHHPHCRLLYEIDTSYELEKDLKMGTLNEMKMLIHYLRSDIDFEIGNNGYDSSKWLSGYVATGMNEDGESIVIASLKGGPVSNDHYPLYDIIMKGELDNIKEIVFMQKYYEDVAGFEGFRVPLASIFFFVLWNIILLLLTATFKTTIKGYKRILKKAA